MIRELIDEYGGPDAVSRRMHKRISPIVFAVVRCGGIVKAAEAMGCSRQHLKGMLKRPTKEWRARWVQQLSAVSGVPMELLLEAQPVGEAKLVNQTELATKVRKPKNTNGKKK